MLVVRCSGSPYEIGLAHGQQAQPLVRGSIAFYTALFLDRCAMSWAQVRAEADAYTESLSRMPSARRYLDELRGLADGAGVDFLDILAINIRTEIMFGLFTAAAAAAADSTNPTTHANVPSDGCTSLAWKIPQQQTSYLAQNWDWMTEQGENLVICHIHPTSPATSSAMVDRQLPNIAMVTEAGIIGKIGFNAHGVGCLLNAIRARGVARSQLPVHFALRLVLESTSRDDAVAKLKAAGVAGSAHILVADAQVGSVGLECTPLGIKEVRMDAWGRVLHTNHLVLDHEGVDEPPWLDDSPRRLQRVSELADGLLPVAGDEVHVDMDQLKAVFRDEDDFPCSINRRQDGECTTQTLFNIIMRLDKREAVVKVGRPSEEGEEVLLRTDDIWDESYEVLDGVEISSKKEC
ncbi:acyl-coenzyme A:6-aminopenicillanic acid acyl-transferase-domain-containing protein [Coniella lustricola]|uniref:Acyl-coenzyme A:6-aminopenicillanic acid acyl-transferase-domain-containing protein n=1 Tax=Coniella lustricola TaxID=2025994 RepID=A0A2T3AAE9_9PEZI|nr:acyl-coenzyme A:6-aminopenicillanic acid acyl-transferase-domain-containing protein [Coniella lustricola]